MPAHSVGDATAHEWAHSLLGGRFLLGSLSGMRGCSTRPGTSSVLHVRAAAAAPAAGAPEREQKQAPSKILYPT